MYQKYFAMQSDQSIIIIEDQWNGTIKIVQCGSHYRDK